MQRKSIKKRVLHMTLFAGVALMTAPVIAQDLGYRWIHSSVGARNLAPTFAPHFVAAAAEVTWAIGLTFYWAGSDLNPPYAGHIAFQEVDLCGVGWWGQAIGYNIYDQPCADPVYGSLTGYCTMSLGANYALIRFNNANGPYDGYEMANLIRHEFGHILGMAHSAGCLPPDGVMAASIKSCWPMYITYSASELDLMDAWY